MVFWQRFEAWRPGVVLLAAMFAVGCERADEPEAADDGDALLRVGSITIDEGDLEHQLKEKHGGRSDAETLEAALEELVRRARFVQAAMDAGLMEDSLVRAEISRFLESRLRETELNPRIAAAGEVSEERLHEIYAGAGERFRSSEKRQVAVLWLDSKGSPDREAQYVEKLGTAREWLFKTGELKDQAEKGFSVLSVDYSEHHASRYKGGVVGWMERGGGMDAWTKAVAEIAFSLGAAGEVSEVVARPEGVFLVRLMAEKEAVLRSFEEVRAQIEREERKRVREGVEGEFEKGIEEKYPVERLREGAEPGK